MFGKFVLRRPFRLACRLRVGWCAGWIILFFSLIILLINMSRVFYSGLRVSLADSFVFSSGPLLASSDTSGAIFSLSFSGLLTYSFGTNLGAAMQVMPSTFRYLTWVSSVSYFKGVTALPSVKASFTLVASASKAVFPFVGISYSY